MSYDGHDKNVLLVDHIGPTVASDVVSVVYWLDWVELMQFDTIVISDQTDNLFSATDVPFQSFSRKDSKIEC